jgi:hypothetical protein
MAVLEELFDFALCDVKGEIGEMCGVRRLSREGELFSGREGIAAV